MVVSYPIPPSRFVPVSLFPPPSCGIHLWIKVTWNQAVLSEDSTSWPRACYDITSKALFLYVVRIPDCYDRVAASFPATKWQEPKVLSRKWCSGRRTPARPTRHPWPFWYEHTKATLQWNEDFFMVVKKKAAEIARRGMAILPEQNRKKGRETEKRTAIIFFLQRASGRQQQRGSLTHTVHHQILLFCQRTASH